MPSSRKPGPTCLYHGTPSIDKGTHCRQKSHAPSIARPHKINKKHRRKAKPVDAKLAAATLEERYEKLFAECIIRPNKLVDVDRIVKKIEENALSYARVFMATGVPWFVVGVIHNMESTLDFKKHLHNGDPLTAKTIKVPKGRPLTGVPPFTWEESASDAITLKKFDSDWSLAKTLDKIERYNGTGYRKHHPDVNSPYLWSGSNHYTKGKYVADGKWDSQAVSGQIGAAVLLRYMVDKGSISFFTPMPLYDASSPIYV